MVSSRSSGSRPSSQVGKTATAAPATHTNSADRDNREHCGTMILSSWERHPTMPGTQDRPDGKIWHRTRR
ncbi:hypothetical protein GCM10022419_058390 [Nonomuraea rosea]|uniref:Uncharacterized protein n=1 Tax=Nonomuraea rosea TaxID=638574 RepID=A0ABP6XQK7_9ACTN